MKRNIRYESTSFSLVISQKQKSYSLAICRTGIELRLPYSNSDPTEELTNC